MRHGITSSRRKISHDVSCDSALQILASYDSVRKVFDKGFEELGRFFELGRFLIRSLKS